MSSYLGNLSVEQIEKRMGIEFPTELKTELVESRQHNADTSRLKPNEWHCFDRPFIMVCGSRELASKIFCALEHKIAEIKVPPELLIVKK